MNSEIIDPINNPESQNIPLPEPVKEIKEIGDIQQIQDPINPIETNPIPIPEVKEKKRSWTIPTGKYTGKEKIALIHALKEMGVTDTEIAKKLKMGRSTVHFLKQVEVGNREVIERIKKNAAAKWWITKHNALEAITPEKLLDASAAQLAMVAGIATDKARLIEGDSTANIQFINEDDVKLQSEILALEARLNEATQVYEVSDNPPSESPSGPL